MRAAVPTGNYPVAIVPTAREVAALHQYFPERSSAPSATSACSHAHRQAPSAHAQHPDRVPANRAWRGSRVEMRQMPPDDRPGQAGIARLDHKCDGPWVDPARRSVTMAGPRQTDLHGMLAMQNPAGHFADLQTMVRSDANAQAIGHDNSVARTGHVTAVSGPFH